jgi:preprotein translocase subunit SecA
VEARNFDIRKQLLEYDDVANDQRKTIYSLRNELLESADVSARIADLRAGVITDMFRQHVPEDSVEEQWDVAGLEAALRAELGLEVAARAWLEKEPELGDAELLARIIERAGQAYEAKIPAPEAGNEEMREAIRSWLRQNERYLMLQVLDSHYREHLAALDHLRQGIHLRGYAQKNPKQEYKREAFELFGAMLEAVKLEVTKYLMLLQLKPMQEAPPPIDDKPHVENVRLQHASFEEAIDGAPAEPTADGEPAGAPVRKPQPARAAQKVGRNEPCPCGSGKKYKHCHGKLA